MPTIPSLLESLQNPSSIPALKALYANPDAAAVRIRKLIAQFQREFDAPGEVILFSTPGRTEVGGNHTDHNGGRVLAAAVDLDVLAVVQPTGDGKITVFSEGYPKSVVHTAQLEMQKEERYSSLALIRGIAARLVELGYQVGGFNACLTSAVPKGSGLSSSAAYEVMIATILNHLYNGGRIDPVEIAVISQFAENNYFGKPCGLMDQTTCSVGGFVTIDFKDARVPVVHKLSYEFAQSGYALVIVETGGNHADLNEDYAALTAEMKSVARELGGAVLRDVSQAMMMAHLDRLHDKVSDRAILRAFHFFGDNQRVLDQVEALEAGQFKRFLQLVVDSGRSSWMLNQNCYSTRTPSEQGIPLALTVSAALLGDEGAWRVHGGGFAGTIQAFVPRGLVDSYVQTMKSIFGPSSCYPISIRASGSVKLQI